jgi:hypothetical protein
MLSTDDCDTQDYAVENQVDGIGQRFKLLGRIVSSEHSTA